MHQFMNSLGIQSIGKPGPFMNACRSDLRKKMVVSARLVKTEHGCAVASNVIKHTLPSLRFFSKLGLA